MESECRRLKSYPLFWALVPLFIASGCKSRTDVTELANFQPVAGRCLELVHPMYVVRTEEEYLLFEEITRYQLETVGDGGFPELQKYESGDFEQDSLFSIVDVMDVGTRLTIDKVWKVSFFEGEYFVFSARLKLASVGDTWVNVKRLLSSDWRARLLLGRDLNESRDKRVLRDELVRFCAD